MKTIISKYLFVLSATFNFSLIYSMAEVPALKDLATGAVIEQITNDFEFAKKLNNNLVVPEELIDYIKSQIVAKNKEFLIQKLYNIEKKFVCSQGPITAIEINKNGDYALIGSNATVTLWGLKSGICIKTFKEHENTVTALAFEQCGNRIGVGYDDGTFCMFNIESGQILFKSKEHNSKIEFIGFYDDILITKEMYSAIVRDENTGQPSYLLNIIDRGILIIFDEHTGKACKIRLFNFNNELQCTIDTYPNSINRAVLSYDGSMVLTSSGDNNEAKLWNAKTGELLKTFSGHIYHVFGVGFSFDGKQAYTVSCTDNILQVKVWNIETGSQIKNLNWDMQIVSLPRKISAISESCCSICFYDETHMIINLFDDAQSNTIVNSIAFIPQTPYAIATKLQGNGVLYNLEKFNEGTKFPALLFDDKICKHIKGWEYNNVAFALFGSTDGHCYLFELIPELNLKQFSFILKLKKMKEEGKEITYDDISILIKNFESGDENFNTKDKITLLRALAKIYGPEKIKSIIAHK